MSQLRPTSFSDPKEFLEQIEPLLLRDEPANSLFLGLSMRLSTGVPYVSSIQETTGIYQVNFERDGQPVISAQRTLPLNVLLVAHGEYSAEDLLQVARQLHADQPDLLGVNAEKQLALEFAKAWTTVTGQPHRLHMDERIYALREVAWPARSSGHARAAVETDVPIVADWILQFMQEAVNEYYPEQARKLAETKIPAGEVMLWDDGGPVSMACSSRPTRNSTCISLVYTPRELRGRGYASNVVAALSQRILDRGYSICTLFTDLSNPTSNSIYQKIGYEPVGDFVDVRFG